MITGKRVRLRAITREDLPVFVGWLNDPDVSRNISIYYVQSLEQEEKWFQDSLTHPVEEQALAIEIQDQDNWKLAGDVGFLNFDQHERSAELGIFIGDKTAWDKGFGTETMQLMVDYGFATLNLNRIYLRVYETNPRGMRCYEKVGFQLEGRMRQAHYLDGKYIDVLLMSILKSEWIEQKMKEGIE
jgi:RimJ/RimL family protein N-acetyltransferase